MHIFLRPPVVVVVVVVHFKHDFKMLSRGVINSQFAVVVAVIAYMQECVPPEDVGLRPSY